MPQPFALITGSTGGIGRELALCFACDHVNLVCVSREEDQLRAQEDEFRKMYGVEIITIAKDLSKPESAREVFSELAKRNVRVTMLVNNAGFATSGEFRRIPAEAELDEMNLNMVTLTLLTKYFLRQTGRHSGI